MFTSFCCGLLFYKSAQGLTPLGRASELQFPSTRCLLGMLNSVLLWQNLGRRWLFRRYFACWGEGAGARVVNEASEIIPVGKAELPVQRSGHAAEVHHLL